MRDRSTRSSTLLDTLLTFCPPGPPERVARISCPSEATTTPGRISRGSSMPPVHGRLDGRVQGRAVRGGTWMSPSHTGVLPRRGPGEHDVSSGGPDVNRYELS